MSNHYKFWTVFSLIVVFIAGVFSGVMLDKYILNGKQKTRIHRPDYQRRSPPRYPTLELMAQELKLTPEQQEKMKGIFKNNEERFRTLRKEMNESLKDIRSRLNKEIKSVLTEKQQAQYDALIEKYLSQRSKEKEAAKRKSERRAKDQGEQK